MKKVVYIISDIEKALAFEWVSLALKQRFELVFIIIGKNNSALILFLKKHSIRTYFINSTAQLASQWLSVFKILRNEKPVVVHTHMWMANLIGLSAAWFLGVRKRIFTRHHAMIHYTEHPSGRKLDKLCNWLATDIVAISENIKTILVRYDGANEKKIHTIHHGFDLQYFATSSDDSVCALRKKYGIKETTFPVIGVIARYTKWKGIQFTIQAFKKIKVQYPHAHLLLANADGDFKGTIESMLLQLPEGSYTQIVFEEELNTLYRLFNVYVHVPTDEQAEAFGQTYVEALAAGIPCVFTISGIAKEFIIHEKNALVVEHENSEQIAASINRILLERDLNDQLRMNGFSAVKAFELDTMLNRLVALYG